jgi:hypothetical protein
MSYTLLVIDVQSYFEAANSRRLIRNCKREIRQAIKDKAAILLVEYDSCGRSSACIAKMVENYNRGFVIIKDDDDGSSEIFDAVNRFDLPRSRFKVAGVNTDACVQDTVTGLVNRLKRQKKKRLSIVVIADACNACDECGHIYGLRALEETRRVKLLNNKWKKKMNDSMFDGYD